MSSSVGSTSGVSYQNYQTDPTKDQFKQDLQAVQTALQSGDLSGAQDAFSKLQDLQKQHASKSGSGQSGSSANSSNPMQKDMSALQSALSSGNLQDAQSAFSQLQTDMKAKGTHHGHHHGGGSSAPEQSSTTSSSKVLCCGGFIFCNSTSLLA